MKRFLIIPCIASILLGGCKGASKEEKITAVNWNWKHFEKTQFFRLGQIPAEITPARVIKFTTSAAGILRLNIRQREMDLEKDFMWAELDAEKYDNENRSLNILQESLEKKESHTRDVEIPKQKLRLEKELTLRQRNAKLLKLIKENPDWAQFADEYLEGESEGIIGDLPFQRASQEVDLTEKELAYLEDKDHQTIDIEFESKLIDWKQRKFNFDREYERSKFKAPFAGHLSLNIGLLNDTAEYPINSGQEIATLRDMENLQFNVPIAYAPWLQLNPMALQIRYSGWSHAPLIADFDSHQMISQSNGEQKKVYTFKIHGSRAQEASVFLGNPLQVELWIILAEPAYSVPKTEVAFRLKDQSAGHSWDETIQALWPGAKLLAEGQTHLAIVPSKKSK